MPSYICIIQIQTDCTQKIAAAMLQYFLDTKMQLWVMAENGRNTERSIQKGKWKGQLCITFLYDIKHSKRKILCGQKYFIIYIILYCLKHFYINRNICMYISICRVNCRPLNYTSFSIFVFLKSRSCLAFWLVFAYQKHSTALQRTLAPSYEIFLQTKQAIIMWSHLLLAAWRF